jgi:DNA invertase Pin-like site-specific DNA recombinase
MMSGPSKLMTGHLERLAVVYIRQSTLAQVRDNTESTMRQYALAEEAARMGWEASRILVIDADLGVSGRTASSRAGFQELVSRVCVGEVGAIFGLEVSRLARSCADLQRLLEFCSLTDTLIVDADGIYDLKNFNDRLLLGLKGTMSEAELHILAGRLQESKRAAARRGELRFPLPVGYLYDEEGRTVMDPDEVVRQAVADVFSAFEETGSAYGVVGALAKRRFPTRAYGGAWAGQIRWGRLSHHRATNLLSNPTYTGAYVFGRFRSRRLVDPDGTIRTKTVELARSEWAVLIQDHHPRYISWETFLANEKRLAANCTQKGACPPREGTALLQGMVACGCCGRAMTTLYPSGRAAYDCSHSRADHTKTPGCRSVMAEVVDGAVAKRLLEVVAPEQIAVALAAADEVTDRRARTSRALELQVERTRYEAVRAERAFHNCDPENRLVARSLEKRWEEKLSALVEAEAAVAACQVDTAPLPPRAELEALARDLPRLWEAPTTSNKDRKRLLRTLVADVTLISEPFSKTVRVGIRWHTGAAEELVVPRPTRFRRTPAGAVKLVERLRDRSDAELIAELSAAGFLTGSGRPFDVAAVRWIRYAYRIASPPEPPLLVPGELTVKDVAARLGIREHVAYYWIRHHQLEARRSTRGRWCIPFPPEVERSCRERIANSVHMNTVTQITAAGAAV